MSRHFEELDHAETRFGELLLRRRRVLSLDTDVWEVKLGGEFLMSSLVNASEIALAELGLAALEGGTDAAGWHVVVGGLGLGYTAATALDHPGVADVLVVEYLPQILGWHQQGRVPLGTRLADDPRCRLEQGDFFTRAAGESGGFDPDAPGRRYDAVLLDIDHSPQDLLHDSHGGFYEPAGLATLGDQLRPGGVFALWSADPPDAAFTARLADVFASAQHHRIEFRNPMLDCDDVNTVYVATTAGA